VFVVWLQYLPLGAALFAEASLVFGLTLLLSLSAIVTMFRVPLGGRRMGTEWLGDRLALAKAP
jgi:hypothetical protein